MSFELVEPPPQTAVIKVVGVGGCGGNAVDHMVSRSVSGVDFIAANTDLQALSELDPAITMQIGAEATKGLGAGADPEVGRAAAMEDRARLQAAIGGADMVFVTAGMGGGTGTGAAPVIAQTAKDLDILTVAVVTKPFAWENRAKTAQQGIADLTQHVDSLIAIPNDKLLTVLPDDVTMEDAFAASNDVLLGAVQGIADIILRPGRINVDFADVCTVMRERGVAIMGTGQASGDGRAQEATEKAIRSPLLEDIDLHDARGVLVNVTTGPNLGMREYADVGTMVREFAAKDATVVVGAVNDPEMGEDMRVTVVATGLGGARKPGLAVSNVEPSPTPAVATPAAAEYRGYDEPAIGRTRVSGAGAGVGERSPAPLDATDTEFLDLPSFLRRNAS